jgi:hypothetical protein
MLELSDDMNNDSLLERLLELEIASLKNSSLLGNQVHLLVQTNTFGGEKSRYDPNIVSRFLEYYSALIATVTLHDTISTLFPDYRRAFETCYATLIKEKEDIHQLVESLILRRKQ